jgi:large subunit ribosomal protein L29
MKKAENKELSIADLTAKLDNLRSEYQNMKMTHALSPMENPLLIRKIRRSIASLMTEINNRNNTVK